MRTINFVLSSGHKKWVLDYLAQNTANFLTDFGSRHIFVPRSRREIRELTGFFHLPKADVNFFLHQDLALMAFKKNWYRKAKINLVNYTHDNKSMTIYQDMFEKTNYILAQNNFTKNQLLSLGIDDKKIGVHANPIDFNRFFPETNKIHRDVVFVSNFYPRKRPELIHRVIEANPKLSFTLIGKRWENYYNFESFKNFENLRYEEFKWETYPDILRQHKVFCSLSLVEGGPVPLLESIKSGLVPVVTDTGTCRDVIPANYHNLILPIHCEIEVINQTLISALKTPMLNFFLDDRYSYHGFAKNLDKIIKSML